MTQESLMPLSAADRDAAVDLWWDSAPHRPLIPTTDMPRYGDVCVTTTCAACKRREAMPLRWEGRVCAACRTNLADTERKQRTGADTCIRDMDAAHERWARFLATLDSDTAERWERMIGVEVQADGRLRRAMHGPRPARLHTSDIAAEITAARAALADLHAKIERTATAYPAIATARTTQRAYLEEMRQLGQSLNDRLIALQEIEAARKVQP